MERAMISVAMNGSMLDEQPTGVGIYSFNLINNLSKFNTESWKQLTVFTPTYSYLSKNIRVVKLSRFLQSSKYGKWAAFCRFMWNTFYYPFPGSKFDLLISPTTHGSFFLRNQVITIHDLLSLRYKNISAHQRFYFKFLLPVMLSRAKCIIAVSEATKKDILHFFKCPESKVKVIYNGYDHSRYYYTEDNNNQIYHEYGVEDYLLAVGPTYPHKNFETLIAAYRGLSETIKRKHPLVIAGGKKTYVERLKALVKECQLESRVHFLGYVPAQLMPGLYREATALVFPSLYEGFGFPLLEAMACGCPVISSNTSSMPEVCGNAAIYFNPSDKSSLASAIEKLMYNEHIKHYLREQGLEQVKKFSWEQTARSFINLIDNQIQSN